MSWEKTKEGQWPRPFFCSNSHGAHMTFVSGVPAEFLYYICAATATVQKWWAGQHTKCTHSTPDNDQWTDPEDLFAMNLGLHLVGKDGLNKHVWGAHTKGERSPISMYNYYKDCFLEVCHNSATQVQGQPCLTWRYNSLGIQSMNLLLQQT